MWLLRAVITFQKADESHLKEYKLQWQNCRIHTYIMQSKLHISDAQWAKGSRKIYKFWPQPGVCLLLLPPMYISLLICVTLQIAWILCDTREINPWPFFWVTSQPHFTDIVFLWTCLFVYCLAARNWSCDFS